MTGQIGPHGRITSASTGALDRVEIPHRRHGNLANDAPPGPAVLAGAPFPLTAHLDVLPGNGRTSRIAASEMVRGAAGSGQGPNHTVGQADRFRLRSQAGRSLATRRGHATGLASAIPRRLAQYLRTVGFPVALADKGWRHARSSEVYRRDRRVPVRLAKTLLFWWPDGRGLQCAGGRSGRHRFPCEVILLAVRWSCRLSPSCWDVTDLPTARGIGNRAEVFGREKKSWPGIAGRAYAYRIGSAHAALKRLPGTRKSPPLTTHGESDAHGDRDGPDHPERRYPGQATGRPQ